MPLATKVPTFTAPDYDVFSPARRNDERGVVMGTPLDGGHSYTPWIGLSTVRELALKHADRVGLVERERLEAAQAHARAVESKLAEVSAERDEALALNANITGLVAAGFKVVRRQGRPPKQEASDGNG